ncbi:hypothetical protein GALMADRAFT_271911 [Galerina marginata CBS 339.88]|uniref:Uncharacterized protein n=1 Tax=Galerina marginata (strain CBS 339.88) TaxID=685588 RepID=A0A067SIM2_GALM3|nr:hypothetical protein GALMADRAFT_271911 [Galerina marginata CBS 339.88]
MRSTLPFQVSDSYPLSDQNCSDEVSKPADSESEKHDIFSSDSLDSTSNCRPEDPPIFNLPFEITAKIFAHYTAENSTPLDYPVRVRSTRSAPLTLSAICRMWREIAFTTPQLWAAVNIFISSFEQIPLLAELASDYMHRSGNLPLTISITNCVKLERLETRYERQVKWLFDVVRHFSARWCRLVLCIPPELYVEFMGALWYTPILEDVRLTPVTGQDELRQVDFKLGGAPRLRHLELSKLFISRIKVPLENLTSLEVSAVCVDEMLKLLKGANQLLSAKFSEILGNQVDFDFPWPPVPLTHHYLRHLDLRPDGNDYYTPVLTFLQSIIVPSLESFVYHGKDGISVDNILILLNSSQIPVTKLEIVLIGAIAFEDSSFEEDLVQLFRGTPAITNLSISLLAEPLRKTVTDSFFALFGDPDFLPQLEVLSFTGWRGFSWASTRSLITTAKKRTVNMAVETEHDVSSPGYKPDPCLSTLLSLVAKNPSTTLNVVDYRTGKDMTRARLATDN